MIRSPACSQPQSSGNEDETNSKHLRQDGEVVRRHGQAVTLPLLALARGLVAPPAAHVLVHTGLAPELQSIRLSLVPVELRRRLVLVALGAVLQASEARTSVYSWRAGRIGLLTVELRRQHVLVTLGAHQRFLEFQAVECRSLSVALPVIYGYSLTFCLQRPEAPG